MDARTQVREFLVARRERIGPQEVGIAVGPGRKVRGLRRSEVAALAGVSVEYYTRIERGALARVSPQVLDAIARALRLDEAERAHLSNLAEIVAHGGTDRRTSTRSWHPHPSLQWVLDAFTAGPAFVRNGAMDVLAENALAHAFHQDLHDMPGTPNLARFTFLSDRARTFCVDWDVFADIAVAILRTEAARDPHSADLHETVEELLSHSAEFETRWRAGEVRRHGTGTKTFRHPVVGELAVAYEALALESAPGLTLTLYTAEPGTVSARRMARLAELTGADRPSTSGVSETPSTAMRSVAVSPDGRGP